MIIAQNRWKWSSVAAYYFVRFIVTESPTCRAAQWFSGCLWDVKCWRDDLRMSTNPLLLFAGPLGPTVNLFTPKCRRHWSPCGGSQCQSSVSHHKTNWQNVEKRPACCCCKAVGQEDPSPANKISLSLAQLQQLTSFPCQLGRKNVFSSVKSHVRRLCTALDDYQSRQWLAITTTTSAVATTTIGLLLAD